LRTLVEAIEARESAEPDLPAWEADARLRVAEANLLRLYRQSATSDTEPIAIDIEIAYSALGSSAEVA
jgi:hypothetical protein